MYITQYTTQCTTHDRIEPSDLENGNLLQEILGYNQHNQLWCTQIHRILLHLQGTFILDKTS